MQVIGVFWDQMSQNCSKHTFLHENLKKFLGETTFLKKEITMFLLQALEILERLWVIFMKLITYF